MRRKKIFTLSILAVLFVSVIGGASAYHEYIYTFEDDHTASCHGGDWSMLGESYGNLTVTLTPSGDLETLEAFTISVVINNFTELDNSAYQNRTTIGISSDLGNNSVFLRSVSDKSFSRRVKVDANGDDLTPTTLGAIAPETPGTYELVITAVAAMNQSTEAPYNFTFAKGSLMVNVVAPAGPAAAGSISGGIIGITLSVVVGVTTIVLLQMRKRIRKRNI